MRAIAITGGIGSGKSTVFNILRTLLPEAKFYSIDDMVHQLYYDEDMKLRLVHVFGTADRKKLSDRAFNVGMVRLKLEELFSTQLSSQLSSIMALDQLSIIEFPLLFEKGWEAKFNYVIHVTASDELRKRRVMSRDGASEDKFERIKATQLVEHLKLSKADLVIHNNFEKLSELEAHVKLLLPRINT